MLLFVVVVVVVVIVVVVVVMVVVVVVIVVVVVLAVKVGRNPTVYLGFYACLKRNVAEVSQMSQIAT